jgi:uncharacterized alkaline shock family protein YloU
MDVATNLTDEGLRASVSVAVKYGCKINNTLGEAVRLLRFEIDRQTAINVKKIDITEKSLVIDRVR